MKNRSVTFVTLSLFAVLLISVAPMAAQTSDPVGPPPTGKILYVDTSENGKNYLAEISPDGTNKTRLTGPYFNMVSPRKCEATGMIGFTHLTADVTSEIYLLKKGAAEPVRLLKGAALEDLSPDGNTVLYTTSSRSKPTLMAFSFRDKAAVKITNARVLSAGYSPDGEWIVAQVCNPDGTFDLWMYSTKGGKAVQITQTPNITENSPVFARDSHTIICTADQFGENSEIVFYCPGTDGIQITPTAIQGLFPYPSPDNNWLVFQVDQNIVISRPNNIGTKVIAIAGQTPTWVK